MKNRTMRVAALLLVLTLMTSCFVGGTFAKYTTNGKAEDNARVAKWGVTVTHDNAIFYDAYKDTHVDYTANEQVDTITVQANVAGADVVAPGTSGTITAFDINGTPEVDVEVTYTPVLTLANWSIVVDGNEEEYCPIIITVNGTDYYIGMSAEVDSIDKLVEAVNKAIVAKGAVYHTNTDLSAVEDDLLVSWRWEFDNTAANWKAADGQTDAKDTLLGNLTGDDVPTIKIEITCTIDQVN